MGILPGLFRLYLLLRPPATGRRVQNIELGGAASNDIFYIPILRARHDEPEPVHYDRLPEEVWPSKLYLPRIRDKFLLQRTVRADS